MYACVVSGPSLRSPACTTRAVPPRHLPSQPICHENHYQWLYRRKITSEKSSGSLHESSTGTRMLEQGCQHERSSEGSDSAPGHEAPCKTKHSTPQPREPIRVWACFSSAKRTWNLSVERDRATGWAGSSGAAASPSRRCTIGASTACSRLELSM